jgi:uncharacterized protein (DUF2225 family)
MSDLLDGLDAFGLGKFEAENLYKESPKKTKEKSKKEMDILKEEFFIFEKKYTCPNCEKEFKNKTVKNGKAKLIGTDIDLRPKHEGIDMAKYEVIVCPTCGYASLSRYFDVLFAKQSKMITAKISSAFRGVTYKNSTFSYKEALERYKLALVNAMVKQAKASEKAYICLRTAWLLRGMGENLPKVTPNYEEELNKIREQENEYLKNALEGFKKARSEENYPMCGMDEITIDYIISALSMKTGDYALSARLISEILLNPSTNARMKERARDLKEIVVAKVKNMQES